MLNELVNRLTKYDKGEARSIVRLLLECSFGLSYTDICAGALDRLSADDSALLETLMQRLEKGEPVQYVTGYASFCNRDFMVRPGVLIPRPETEELVEKIIRSSSEGKEKEHILDIGTGSGCIAITLALDIPDAEVTAWDISEEALAIAQENAKALGAGVRFQNVDVLSENKTLLYGNEDYNTIVSNPPYICEKEAGEMESNVLEHEPHTALFVPDDDPLLFYRHIAEYAKTALKHGGRLFFEINPLYAEEIKEMLAEKGFVKIFVKEDLFGKQRIIKAQRKL